MDREVMEDIVQTGKRYQGYGVNLREYCAGIGISASRWFRITKAWCKELSPKAIGKPTASPYALTEEEQQLVVAYALDNPRYYHREMAYRMIDENIVYTSPSTVYRILKKHGLIRENVQKKRYGWVHRYSNEAQYPHKVSMGNENFFGKKIESDFLNTKRKRGGNHDEGQANVQS
jgi:Fe2+ or Zn2+ uptake regulation protein